MSAIESFTIFLDSDRMDCQTKTDLEQHLSDIRSLATTSGITPEQREVIAARAEKYAIGLLKDHDATGHNGKRCPFATTRM